MDETYRPNVLCRKCAGHGYYYQMIAKPMGNRIVEVPAFKKTCEACNGTGFVVTAPRSAAGKVSG